MLTPPHFRLCYSAEHIARSIAIVATKISDWQRDLDATKAPSLIAMPVLRGGLYFFADLSRALAKPVEMQLCQSVGYILHSTNQSENVELQFPRSAIHGRSILLVDDICDSGRTLKKLEEELYKAGAKEVRAAVLIRRVVQPVIYEPHYVCFDHPGEEWFVGYGMEENELWRNLPGVYTVAPNGTKKEP